MLSGRAGKRLAGMPKSMPTRFPPRVSAVSPATAAMRFLL